MIINLKVKDDYSDKRIKRFMEMFQETQNANKESDIQRSINQLRNNFNSFKSNQSTESGVIK